MLGHDSLRLVAALTHTLPAVIAVLVPDHGPEVVVGADRRCLPDLSPCELRRLVAAERIAGAPELTWLESIEAVHLGGPEVADVVEDVVRVGVRDEPVLAFATVLGPRATRAVLRDAGTDLLERGEADRELLRSLRASTFHDEMLGVTTVVVAEAPGPGSAPRRGAGLHPRLPGGRAHRLGGRQPPLRVSFSSRRLRRGCRHTRRPPVRRAGGRR